MNLDLEKLLDKEIKNLKREMEVSDKRAEVDVGDNFQYCWNFCGERDKHEGKIEALEELKQKLKGNPFT